MTLENINPLETITDLDPVDKAVPTMAGWYLSSVVSGVTEENVSWMLAAGWTPAGTHTDTDGTVTYRMEKTSPQSWRVLQDLIKDFTEAYNDGRKANDIRYDDTVKLWSEMLDKAQMHMASQRAELDGRVTVYLSTLDDLQADYDSFYAAIQAELDAIELSSEAERAQINERFNNLLARTRQELASRGFYSSGLVAPADARVERERTLVLLALDERLQRQTVDVTVRKSQIYADVLRMRMGIVQAKMGLTNEQQHFAKYQLDERNKILIGLCGFMERRTDAYPDLGTLAQLTASLGEAGAATWQSM